MRRRSRIACAAAACLAALSAADVRAEAIIVASKVFTESVILAEIAAQLLNDSGQESVHRRELGGTRVLWSALTRGDI